MNQIAQQTQSVPNEAGLWRRPTEADKKRKKLIARNPFEKKTYAVQWNEKDNYWSLHGYPHISVLVTEIRIKAPTTKRPA